MILIDCFEVIGAISSAVSALITCTASLKRRNCTSTSEQLTPSAQMSEPLARSNRKMTQGFSADHLRARSQDQIEGSPLRPNSAMLGTPGSSIASSPVLIRKGPAGGSKWGEAPRMAKMGSRQE